MASPSATAENSAQFSFSKSAALLSGGAAAELELDASKSPAVGLALASNAPFPSGEVNLGALSLGTNGGKSIGLGSAASSVAFSFDAGAQAGLGVYPTAAEMTQDLALALPELGDLTFEAAGAQRYLALKLGYDLAASAKGAVGLGVAGGLTFGVEGAKDAFFVVVRAFAPDPPSRTATAETIETWKLPSQIRALDDLPPGSWLVSETDGSLGLKLGAKLGFDHNWIRRFDLGKLSGDVGLRIQAQTEVALGLELSGKFSLAIGRESLDPKDGKVRLRLYKQRKKGWSFALNAGAQVTSSTGQLLPAQLDDFISAVLGTYGPQVVEDLRAVTSTPANTLAGDFLTDFAEKEFQKATGVSAQQAFDRAHDRIQKFLTAWDSLGSQASTALWGFVSKASPAEVSELHQTLDALANDGDQQLVAAVRSESQKVDFFQSPLGQWLESVAGKKILPILSGSSELADLRQSAKTTADILDGKVLTDFTSWVDQKLSLQTIENADFASLDNAAREKLSQFLEKPLDAAGLETVRQVIVTLQSKGSQIYSAALAAANQTYGFSLAATYQSSTTKTALLDVTFDLGADPSLIGALQSAIHGDFGSLLADENSNITLREAALTHQISRSSHVEIHLPYYTSSTDNLADSLAKMTVQDDGGRLFVYDLQANDETVRKDRWASDFAVSLRIPASPQSGIRYYDGTAADKEGGEQPSGGSTYRFRQAFPQATNPQLIDQLGPIVEQYLPDQFGVADAPGQESLAHWLADLDKHLDATGGTGTFDLGNVLIGFETQLPAAVLANWLEAPGDAKSDPYFAMSLAIQRSLRLLLPYVYFQNPKRYTNLDTAAALLLYASLPPSTSASYSNSELTLNTNKDVYWDFADETLRRAFAYSSSTTAALARNLERAADTLLNGAGLQGQAKFYSGSQLETVRTAGLSGVGGKLFAGALLTVEAEVIQGAVKAGRRMAKFVAESKDQPAQAIESLAEAGDSLTKAFHKRLTDLFDPSGDAELLRNLGSVVFLAASQALGGDAAQYQPTSILEIDVLDPAAPFPPAGYLEKGTPPAASTVKLSQRIIGTPAPNPPRTKRA